MSLSDDMLIICHFIFQSQLRTRGTLLCIFLFSLNSSFAFVLKSLFCFSIALVRILELGSGTGVLGMALYTFLSLRHNDNNHHHPIVVALTDGDAMAVELLQKNLNHVGNRNAMTLLDDSTNHVHDHDHHNGNEGKCSGCCKATCFQWGVPESWNQFDDWCRREFLEAPAATCGSSRRTNEGEEAEYNVSLSLSPPPPFVFDVIVAGKPKIISRKTKRLFL
jgi:Lysine methyltransferase